MDRPIWERGQEGGITRPIDRDVLFKNLCNVSRVLTKHKIKHWLSHGTALGAYRDDNIIAWDDDADIGCDMVDRHKIYEAQAELRSLGFFSPNEDEEGMPYYDTVFIRDGEKIEVWWFDRDGDFYIYDKPRCGDKLKHPAKYYEKVQPFAFRGELFYIPNYIEEWLEMMYSEDWMVPQKGRKYNYQ